MKNNNNFKYVLYSTVYSIALMFSTGAFIQTFLLYMGLSDSAVSIFSTVTLVAQSVSMFLCMFFVDKMKTVIKIISVMVFALPLIYVVFLLVRFDIPQSVSGKTAFVFIGGGITNLILGVYNILIYKLPYEVIDIATYGKYSSICGIVSGLLSFFLSLGVSYLMNVLDYLNVITVVFIASGVLWIISGFINLSYKDLKPINLPKENVSFFKIFTLPEIYKTIVPNTVRGIGVGIIGFAVVFGTREQIITQELSVYVAPITAASSMGGYFLYLLLATKMSARKQLICFAVISCIAFPLSVATKSSLLFFVFFFISNAAVTNVGGAIPIIIYDNIDVEYIGNYTVLRMLLLTVGTAISGVILVPMLNAIGGVLTLLSGGICLLVCGLSYFIVFKDKPKA